SGGVTSTAKAKGHAIRLVASGPAGGVVGAAALGQVLGFPNVITTDVGGTSFDVGLVVDGEPLVNARPVFGKYHTVLPVTDVASIGAGGCARDAEQSNRAEGARRARTRCAGSVTC